MTTSVPAIAVSRPPRVVLRLVNPVLDRLLRSPIGAALRRRYLTLTFTGHKYGRIYHFPVRAHRIQGALYAVTGARWRLNFRGGAPVQIAFEGRISEYRAELIEDPETVAEVLVKLTYGYGTRRAQHKLALKFNTLTAAYDDFVAAARREHICAIRFIPA